MTKTICDMCGSTLETVKYRLQLTKKESDKDWYGWLKETTIRTMDLCEDCASKYKTLIPQAKADSVRK